jgi:hypothetical protein
MSGQQPAGWFPDPDDPTKQRYWDGQQWTEHRSPAMAVNYEQATQIRAKSRRTAVKVIGALVVVGLLIWGVSAMFGGGSSDAPATAASASPDQTYDLQPAKFKATVTSTRVQNPATLTVFARVKNVSKVEGRAQCFVEARDPSGTYDGYDNFNVRGFIQPGEEGLLRADLTVTNEGAIWATEITVDCEDRDV